MIKAQEWSKAANYLRQNPKALDAVLNGDKKMLRSILKYAGLQSPTASDMSDLRDFAAGFTTKGDIDAEQEARSQAAEARKQQFYRDYGDAVRRTMMKDPKAMLIYAAIQAASSGVRAAGDIAQNNGNRLAQAILSASRTNSDAQNAMYGPSRREKAGEMWANERMRRGNNVKTITDAIANTTDKVLGTYEAEDRSSRYRQMAPWDAQLGMGSNYFQSGVQEQKIANKVGQQ